MKDFRMSYRNHVCGWFREDGCLFFNSNTKEDPNNYMSFDSRALPDLKKQWKAKIDEQEGPKVKGEKYPTEQWSF